MIQAAKAFLASGAGARKGPGGSPGHEHRRAVKGNDVELIARGAELTGPGQRAPDVQISRIRLSDKTSHLPEPPMGTILYAKELPDVGGDTLFANMYMAYETLSDGMKTMLAPLNALNSAANQAASDTRKDRIEDSGKDASTRQTEAVHPVVRTHPETGRKALYVNRAHTVRFDGMTEAESAPLLAYLFAHQIGEEFTCRFRWSPGAIAFWDNRCTQHYPVNDYAGHKRLLHRITLKGDAPR